MGKLVQINADLATVEYFLSPAVNPLCQQVPFSSLSTKEIEQETRAYVHDPNAFTWSACRVLAKHGDSEYLVRFPNRSRVEPNTLVLADRVFVRCDRSIDDPTPYLEHRINDTPFFHQRRAAFVRTLTDQRGVCAGMTGLLSSAIHLERHQIEVVRRVLQDPHQRYLLADEVGLGKTIEAGVILRQYVLDDPAGHRALILVPPHLVEQWRDELRDRLLLGPLLGESIFVASHEDGDAIEKRGPTSGMLILDEAHQLTAWATLPDGPQRRRFEAVRELVVNRPELRLLLLSATPALHNSRNGFHALLHLLDPVVYRLDDTAGFRTRLEQHQAVAELYHLFQPDESNSYLRGQLENLEELFPQDARLRALAESLRPLLSFGADADAPERIDLVRSIRAHVSEAYRLHRRLLRNRRSSANAQRQLPERTGLTRWTYSDEHLPHVLARLDEWRVQATAHADNPDLAECLRLFAQAAGCDSFLLANLVEARLNATTEGEDYGLSVAEGQALCSPLFDGEGVFLQRLLDSAENAESEERVLTLEQHLRVWFGENRDGRAVVFVSSPGVAEEVFHFLRGPWRDQVARHGETGWEAFRISRELRILVCDRWAEDGLNLQGSGTVLVHYDLPWSPNRIEQRLGRIDRYGVETPVHSFTLLAEQNPYSRAWCDHLDNAYRLFARSIAALQYLVEEEMEHLLPAVFDNGPDAIVAATDSLSGEGGSIEETLGEIAVLDELDAVEAHPLEEEFVGALLDADRTDAEGWCEALGKWAVGTLAFRAVHRPKGATDFVRFQFQRPDRKGASTLMPVGRLVRHFEHVIDRDETEEHPREPITYRMTSDRDRSCERKTALLRVGDPFLDALADYIRWDDRGMCFAMWRHRPDRNFRSPAEIYFRLDFVVECPIDAAREHLDADASRWSEQAIRRRADWLLPPFGDTLWLDENRELVEDEAVLELLSENYDKVPREGRPRDYNLDIERWAVIEPHFPKSSWPALVQAVRGDAERILRERPAFLQTVEERAELAETILGERSDQHASRLAFLPEGQRDEERRRADLDDAIGRALLAGIRTPGVRLDSLGAIFLADWNPFAAMPDE